MQLSDEIRALSEDYPLLKITEDFGDPSHFAHLKYQLASFIERYTVSDSNGENYYTREQARDFLKEDLINREYISKTDSLTEEGKAQIEKWKSEDVSFDILPDGLYAAVAYYKAFVQDNFTKEKPKPDLIDKIFRSFYNKSTYGGISEEENADLATSDGEFDADYDTIVDPQEDGEGVVDEEKEKVNHRDHIEEADAKDRYVGLFQNAKDFLGTIFIDMGNGVKELLDPKSAFAILAEKLTNISSDPRYTFKDILVQFKKSSNVRTEAVKKRLIDVLADHDKVSSFTDTDTYNLEDPNSSGEMLYSSIKEQQPDVFMYNGVKVQRRADQNNQEWFDEIEKETGIPFEVAVDLYKKTVAIDMINAVFVCTGSLRKRTPFFGRVSLRRLVNLGTQRLPVKSMRYLKMQIASPQLELKKKIAEIFQKLTISDLKTLERSLVGVSWLDRDRIAVVNALVTLNLIAENKKSLCYTYHYGNGVFLDLKSIINTLINYKKITVPTAYDVRQGYAYADTDSNGVETIRMKTMFEFLTSEHSKRMNNLCDLISKSFSSYECPVWYEVKGSLIYNFKLTSHVDEVIEALIDRRREGLKGLQLAFSTTEFYCFNPFLHKQENILINGSLVAFSALSIYELIDHEFVLDENNVIIKQDENRLQEIQRKYFMGFMPNSAVNYNDEGRAYYMFISPQSPEIREMAINVKLLSREVIKGLIRHALIQETKRPKCLLDGYYPSVSNFPIIKNGKLFYPPVVANPLDESNLSIRVSDILSYLEWETEQLVEEILELRLILPEKFGREVSSMVRGNFLFYSEEKVSKLLSEEFILANTINNYGIESWMIKDYLNLVLLNNCINGYFINQIIYGDSSFYNFGNNNLMCNFRLAWKCGYRGRVHDDYGIPSKIKILVVHGENEGQYSMKLSELIGGGIISYEFACKLMKGFSRGMRIQGAIQLAYYQVDAIGVPRAIECSAIIMDDCYWGGWENDIVEIDRLKDFMKNKSIDAIVHKSSFKIGAPISTPHWSDVIKGAVLDDVEVIEIYGDNFRIYESLV